MADDADMTQDREEAQQAAQVLAIRTAAAAIPNGKPGDCDSCGEWSGRLVHGDCAPCRDRYKLS